MKVSVIIPVFNDNARLRLCLQALAEQTYPHDDFEVLVVDNGSTESPQEVVEEFEGVSLLVERKPGSYAARNLGLRHARGEMIAFTDADCLPEPVWLQSGVAMLDANPNCDIVGGDIQIFPKRSGHPNAAELYDIAFGLPQAANIARNGLCVTANLFTRRECFERFGPFDEQAFGGGDHDWCSRVVNAGGRVLFAKEALVCHPARDKVVDLVRQSRRQVGGRIDRNRKAPKRRSVSHRLWMLSRWTVPNVRKMFRARKILAERGYHGIGWFRTIPVILAVQYSQTAEAIKKYLGTRSERQ